MKRPALWFTVGVAAAGALVLACGLALVPEAAAGVAVGVVAACAVQLLLFGAASLALPGQRFAAYGVGMIGRLLLVVVAALVLVPASGLPPAPTLFSLVSVLFLTTLIEPVVFAAEARKPK